MNLYELQWFGTEWERIHVFQMEPRHLSHFLDYFWNILACCKNESDRAEWRIRRIPYEYGLAKFEYRGENRHYTVEH